VLFGRRCARCVSVRGAAVCDLPPRACIYSGSMLRHVKAQTAIYVVGLVIMILASATLYVVGGKVQELHTFLGWERVMFWLMIGLMIYSVFGCIANTCARARAGDATTTPTWVYFALGIGFSMALLYAGLQTSFVQGGTWIEMKHNWEVVRYRFPEYSRMNVSTAVPAAGRYYKNTVASVAVLLWLLFFAVLLSTVCAGRALEGRKVSRYILHITSSVGMVVAAVLAGYAISLAGKPDQFGLTAHLPYKTGTVAGFLFASALTGLLGAVRSNTTFWYVANIVLLSLTLIVLLGSFISSYVYAQGVVANFDAVPDAVLNDATRTAGVNHMGWTKADFKSVVRTHFASIGVIAMFVTVVVVTLFSTSLYSCCVVKKGWQKKFKWLNCRSCRCAQCVRLCSHCGPMCAECCASCCDVKGDPDDRRLTGV
jgi:hypothetical protein